jgi:hypothetical protein
VIGAETLVPAIAVALLITGGVFIVRAFLSRPSSVEPTEEQKHKRDVIRGATIGLLVALVETVAAVLALIQSFGLWQLAAFLVVGPLIAAVAGAVAHSTNRFPFLAAATFFGIALFLAGTRFAAAWGNTDVRPAAVVRENKKAIIGYFIAEDSSRVYLARLDLVPRSTHVENHIDRGLSRIVAIRKDQITDISIGPPKDALAARDRAKELADELCGMQIPPAASQNLPQVGGPASRDPSVQYGQDGAGTPDRCWSRPPGS